MKKLLSKMGLMAERVSEEVYSVNPSIDLSVVSAREVFDLFRKAFGEKPVGLIVETSLRFRAVEIIYTLRPALRLHPKFPINPLCWMPNGMWIVVGSKGVMIVEEA